MSSNSDDDETDNNIYDQLKSIRPFPVEQLYLLHPDVLCPPTTSIITGQGPNLYHDQELYNNLVEYEQLRDQLIKVRNQVKESQAKINEHTNNVWTFKEESPRKIGMCQQGKIAEATLKYEKASLDSKQLDLLKTNFTLLPDIICGDFMHYSYEIRIKRIKISAHLTIAYQSTEEDGERLKLKSTISTLIDFIKRLADFKSDFVTQCRNWLRCLIRRFLEQETTDSYRFIISQLCRGPSGTADWSADLIECKPGDQTAAFESIPHYITHCSTLLSELFNNLKLVIKSTNILNENQVSTPTDIEFNDQNWSLIDPRFSCSEELNLTSLRLGNILSESDIIKFCLRIPVTHIFRDFVKNCLESKELYIENDQNYEFVMLKLLTIGTVIIKTFQTGLETFNSIQYGTLIEYLSSQIGRTVRILSDQWTGFKRRLKEVDNALMMRLQVEYDNFILRSILIILELRQSGIWRHLSRHDQQNPAQATNCDTNNWSSESIRPTFAKLLQATGLIAQVPSQTLELEILNDQHNSSKTAHTSSSLSSSLTYKFSVEWFKEVSESMLWHILWQFYHKAFISSCDYHSDNYWLEKFKEKSVIYLFVNKIKDSSICECSYLLNSITSMLLSRTRQDSKLVHFIAIEIFNMSFKHKELKSKTTQLGIRSLIESAEKFPNLISIFISFVVNEDYDHEIVDLFKGCSLIGWICDDTEFQVIASWLTEYPLSSHHNKIARVIITKLLINSPKVRSDENSTSAKQLNKASKKSNKHHNSQCFVDLKLRRKLALLFYDSSVRHLPEINDFGPLSLGTFIEVAFGDIFCEKNSNNQINLLDLATETNYQQFYIWVWRQLFTFRLHILNQQETDWNDVQARSGTSRSIKNTVLLNDSFHPVPSIQDAECLYLYEGVKKFHPIASFVYLQITDVTWQADTLDPCLDHLNYMANSNHLTPSLMNMSFLTICHLNELNEVLSKDQRFLEYFTTIITSSFDTACFASLIFSQMQNLRQYRQIQLSQFYITILMEVASTLTKKQSSSWFFGNEYSLEKIASLLDYIVKFNFTTQRLEIIRKFYDCSYSIQSYSSSTGWFGSLLSPTQNVSPPNRKPQTILHLLTQKFQKYIWLRWVTTECDTLHYEKIWEDIVLYLSTNERADLDSTIKKVQSTTGFVINKSSLPIYSWVRQIFDIVETDLSHPLCPLIWYNFFLNYFANSLNGVSVGKKLIPQETLTRLLSRLDSLFNYHLYRHRNWSSACNLQQNSLAQLYRAFRLWLQDVSLLDAYVDIDRLRVDYMVPLLKSIMESSTEAACDQYIDIQSIETQNENLSQIWLSITHLHENPMVFVNTNQNEIEVVTRLDDEVSDAISLVEKVFQGPPLDNKILLISSEEDLKISFGRLMQVSSERSFEEVMIIIKQNFHSVFEESSIFRSNINELINIKSELVALIQQLYRNKRHDYIKVASCADGPECSGPARIKFEVEEATIDDRKSECVKDRQRQTEELVNELLVMPTDATVHSTIVIENNVRQLIEDSEKADAAIKSIFQWISEPETYSHLSGCYYVAKNLLVSLLGILSESDRIDSYNSALIDLCTIHPGSVNIFSPHLLPAACSTTCFLNLYIKISTQQSRLGPTAMFVILTKFDVNAWLDILDDKEMHHDIIRATCTALKSMGKQPDDCFEQTFGLYKRHLQVELADPGRRRPKEIALVLKEFLKYSDEQSLAPTLWTEFMMILGLEKQVVPNESSLKFMQNSSIAKDSATFDPVSDFESSKSVIDESTLTSLIEDINRLADSQKIFDYHAISSLIQDLSKFFKSKSEIIEITLLEYYQDYLDQFSILMTSVTFMWLKVIADCYPDNHDLIWKQEEELWYDWVFLSKNCQNVGKTSYNLVASLYVASLRFMIYKLPGNTQSILKCILTNLLNYVSTAKQVVYLELSLLQRSLRNLPWSSLVAGPDDFRCLAMLSTQVNYNISDFVSHLLLQIDLKESLSKIEPEDMPKVSEWLATSIVLQSNQLKSLRLHGTFLSSIPVNCIEKIASLILPRMESVNLEHSQSNKLLVNLLRFMCIKSDSCDSESDKFDDGFERSAIYSRFVSNYLLLLIKSNPLVIRHHVSYLHAIMDNTLRDLKILVSSNVDISKKTAIYENLLGCCNNAMISLESRLLVAKTLMRSEMLKDRPIVVMEIFNSIGLIISDARVLVHMVERMITMYLNMNGHYEKVWKSLKLRKVSSELYLEACIEENAPLALLVYFESLTGHWQDLSLTDMDYESSTTYYNKIWSSYFHWISKITLTAQHSSEHEFKSNAAKLATTWLRLLGILERNLSYFIFSSAQFSNQEIGENCDSIDNDLEQPSSQITRVGGDQKIAQLSHSHKSMLDCVNQLISIYDSHNSAGLWSYLKFNKNNQASEISIIGLAVACFLTDRVVACLSDHIPNSQMSGVSEPELWKSRILEIPSQLVTLMEEFTRLRLVCLRKLEAARKSKHHVDKAQFIEALIESVNRNDKVHYSEVVRLIITFVKSINLSSDSEDFTCMSEILLSLSE